MTKWLLAIAALVWALPASAQVYRCGNKYQASPCPNGREVNVSNAISGGLPDSEIVYLCKQYNGQLFWIDKPCHHYPKSMLERQVLVPAELTWDEKVAYARKERNAAEALQQPPVRPRVATQARQQEWSCKAYDDALEQNAAAARAGGPPRHMDWLAAQRRDIWKRQHDAGC